LFKQLKPKSEFSRNILTLMTGTTIAQAIPIVIAPILTRIYTPEDFGVFALYISVAAIHAALATGRYELAIMLPKKDSDAAHIVIMSIIITLLTSFFLCLVIFLFSVEIVSLLGNSEIGFWLYLIPLSILLTGVYQCFAYWNNRLKKYKQLAIGKMLQSSAMAGAQIGLIPFGLGFGGLIAGMLIGQVVVMIYLYRKSWSDNRELFQNVTYSKMIYLMKKYVNFPKYLVVAHTMNAGSSQSPVILINTLFASAQAGFYTLTQRVISAPMAIIARSIGDVFRQEASNSFICDGKCVEIYNKTFRKLLYISLLPFFLFFFIAPSLFSFVFGEEWRVAGEYARILTPMFFLQFITSPLSVMFMIAEKQKYDLIWQSFLLIVTVSSVITGFYFSDINISLILFSISYSVMYTINGFMTWKISKGRV